MFTGNVEARAGNGASRSARWRATCTSARGRRTLPGRDDSASSRTRHAAQLALREGDTAYDHAEATTGRNEQPHIRVESRDHAVATGIATGPVTINQELARPPARSAYLHQVRRIAPPALIGREQELAELARFCLESGRGPYAWWQGEAWAGKSALLSTFVLNPPPPVRERAKIVSFFITGRLASQDTRGTFTSELLLQLAQLTGQALPDGAFTEGIREGHVLDLLNQAARACQESGKRLVLIVDGLDEDRSVTGDVYAHSIAALLPVEPPPGMRVIVSARPNPPVPNDVPGWHPLRDPAIIRPLPASEHARDIQLLSERELTRLLDGNPPERDLLGILATARGGLSQQDLAELTGTRSREIKKILNTVRPYLHEPCKPPGTRYWPGGLPARPRRTPGHCLTRVARRPALLPRPTPQVG